MTEHQDASTSTQGVWQFDPFHTQVEFATKHLGMMTVRGHFAEVSASGKIDPNKPEESEVEVTIQAASIRSHNEVRDNDLRSPNFLDIENSPTITFKSTKIEPAGKDRYTMVGDLTIKGVTKPVTLKVMRYGEFSDPRMGHRIAYSAEGRIDRRDFGLTFNMMLDGKWVVGNEIDIQIEGELVEQKQG
ncbi:MAG TPA: YceI family protein [Ktedonosporobacter sp.]|nr:YceI family protein [Ktedonosporobacter sp.]